MFSRKAQIQVQPQPVPVQPQPAPKEEDKSDKKDPALEQIKRLDKDLSTLMKDATNYTAQIVARIRSLGAAAVTDTTYASSFPTISLIQNKYVDLDNLLHGEVANIATPRVQLDVPAPPSTLTNAVSIFNSLEMLQAPLRTRLLTLSTKVANFANLIQQAKGANKEWVADYIPKASSLQNAMLLAWELGLVTKRITITLGGLKLAYPAMQGYRSLGITQKIDLDKWKKTAVSMSSFSRVYGKEYTFPQVLYHFTKDWDMFERFNFKKWYNWSYRKANKENKMEKQAADFITNDRLLQFTNKRKKLMNRVGLVRKALMDLVNSGLIAQDDSNKLYKIIAMLEFEAMRIKAPKIAAARTRRAGKLLEKHGFSEGKDMLYAAAEEMLSLPLVKTAEEDKKPEPKKDSQEAVDLLRQIKKEMDVLNYSRHLDVLYGIKKRLEAMGRAGDMEAVEKIIRDDLSSLEKLNKKLTEVYTNLSKVPLELSESEDISRPSPTSIETPLEVKEEDVPTLESKPEIQPNPEAKSPLAPAQPVSPTPARAPTPIKPMAPAIERNIPNV